ncbi:MAG: hypothetical protein ACREOB_04625 [Thermodesulfobacteriota bacterium]
MPLIRSLRVALRQAQGRLHDEGISRQDSSQGPSCSFGTGFGMTEAVLQYRKHKEGSVISTMPSVISTEGRNPCFEVSRNLLRQRLRFLMFIRNDKSGNECPQIVAIPKGMNFDHEEAL